MTNGLELREVAVDGVPRPLTLHVAAGEIIALVVPNDAEAVTRIADTVVGLATPRGGEIYLDGQLIAVAPAKRRAGGRARHDQDNAERPPIALVPPDGGLLPHLTVADNISYGRRNGDGLPKTRVEGLLRRTAAEFGISDVLDQYPNEIAEGRWLLVGLARALQRYPRALVLEDRRECPQWTDQLTRTNLLAARAVLVVTDTESRIARIADHVHRLDQLSANEAPKAAGSGPKDHAVADRD